ncbi:uncharacterized protein EI90DRAFT_3060473 [Cantharellus anzutake]|uniref:uncharacterized protein n=1 Tax=Cantharellus anzutake TaxID=1750568 RepID=UPI001903F72D|nr:uncharacterized protein EI90DRAFT_3060473 [Cantharellus anzutake]KAF8330359.1 hypothetical protein EI90DRAFT_3060473 [Cantharellus anzutake]
MGYSHNYSMTSPTQHYNHHGSQVGSTQLPPFSALQGMAPPPSPFSAQSHRPSSGHLPQPPSPPHHALPISLPPMSQGQPPRNSRYSQSNDPAYSETSHGSGGHPHYSDASPGRMQPHLQQLQPGSSQQVHRTLLHHTSHHRQNVPSSNVTSVESSDDEGELPASGLARPLPALQDLAALATQQAERGDTGSANRTRSPSPENSGSGRDRLQGGRASKRRKTVHAARSLRDAREQKHHPDVVTKCLISEEEARALFQIFYDGCSTFLPIFDKARDTYDALHERSPFCVNAICMVAAKVRDGGGPEGEIFKICQEEVRGMACTTLFSPVSRQEAIQATIIVAGWSSDGGWLSLGHAVRMAFEFNMHKAWPKLLKKIRARHQKTLGEEDLQFVISTRTWFCLYLYEHQLSFSTGRPAILREDDSVADCREFLLHPLTIPDDTRLVSMVELAMIRERLHKKLSHSAEESTSTPPDAYATLHKANQDFQQWNDYWDEEFARGHYQDVEWQNFQRQSLQVQRYFAELFHGASALRGIRGKEDVPGLPKEQRDLALRCLEVAKKGLETCVKSTHYKEGLKYAVHYTHMSATFAASFLIRLARLFPDEVDVHMVRNIAEDLANELSQIPAASRYALTLRIMLRKAHQRKVLPPRVPENGAEMAPNHVQEMLPHQPPLTATNHYRSPSDPIQQLTPPDMPPGGASIPVQHIYPHEMLRQQYAQMLPQHEPENGEVPVWLSESTLGDLNLAQYSLEAFIVPAEYGGDRIW